MNQFERTFIFMTIGLHIAMFIKVGYESTKWSQLDFIFAYFVCILVFIQFLIRYFVITYKYRTETSILGWLASFLIVVVSLILIQSTLHIKLWLLLYGILLVLASIKTAQSRKQVIAATNNNIDTIRRLQEYMIYEFSFGVFMLIFFIVIMFGHNIIKTSIIESATFFGTLFAVFFALISIIINIKRLATSRTKIEKYIKELS